MSTVFDANCVGLANATSAGWGNLGGGVAHVVVVPFFLAMYNSGKTNEEAWRVTLALPPVLLFVTGVLLFFLTDDCPLGDIKHLQDYNNEVKRKENERLGKEPSKPLNMGQTWMIAARNWKTWVAALCYAMSFGAELTVNGNMASYFKMAFALNPSQAANYAGVCVCTYSAPV